ncbi:glycoside hydrolase family 16 protein [Frankia sp. Cppng1_Ct_nod]|uniref:glycoside hydrolase family 16 protein n=1 Tax=Frankia sp. Cppng1_Ct_nod TaxID=2897162 RepID=UPI001041B9EF|nr:glycoside hydrolase family 16 protein [Frankia sp. Cppng1_Ct_nod]
MSSKRRAQPRLHIGRLLPLPLGVAAITTAVLLGQCGTSSPPSAAAVPGAPLAGAAGKAATGGLVPTGAASVTSPSPTGSLLPSAPASAPASTVPAVVLAAAVASPAAGSGWGAPVFADDFTGSSPDTRNWFIYDSPGDPTQARSRDRVEMNGGELQLRGGLDPQGRDLTGGVATTLNQLYGRWEARIRVDTGAGYSAVAMLWPQSEHVPPDGSIGFLEAPANTRPKIGLSVHNGPDNAVMKTTLTADLTQWRTVAVEWLPDRITFSIDGAVVYTVSRPSSGANPIPGTSPMHLALQIDKDCAAASCRDANTPPCVTMHIDWVHIYRKPA